MVENRSDRSQRKYQLAPLQQRQDIRLVNLGLIKSISPILDMSKISKEVHPKIANESIPKETKSTIKSGLKVDVTCAYCEGDIHGSPKVLRFGEYERFFCCTSCKTLYKEKHGGRINSIIKHLEN
jgi:Lrp/AsnC family leucine-responsive transcriptional regulator